jgi:hypothetical protein
MEAISRSENRSNISQDEESFTPREPTQSSEAARKKTDLDAETKRNRFAQDGPSYSKQPLSEKSSSVAMPKAMTAEDCSGMSQPMLDHNARAIRTRLGSNSSYAGREQDVADLSKVEAEQNQRNAKSKTEASASPLAKPSGEHVEICKRPADLGPNKHLPKSIQGDHWWLRTSSKDVGMGQANGNVPGHGESPNPLADTKLIDHSREVPRDCEPVKGVTEECIDRKLEVGKNTHPWVLIVNDCHSVVRNIIRECRDEQRNSQATTETTTRAK